MIVQIKSINYRFFTRNSYYINIYTNVHYSHFVSFRGWNAIINDNLIANAFSIQILALAVLNALLGSVVMMLLSSSLQVTLSTSAIVAGAVFGALLGGVVGSLMVSCLDSAVCMVFVCFAEDPSTLQVSKFYFIFNQFYINDQIE